MPQTPESRRSSKDTTKAMAKAMRDVPMPDLKSIVCAFMNLARGPKGIAKMLMREYRAAKPGSMLRTMIIQTIIQGAKALTVKEAARDTSLLSDADIDKEIARLMAEAKDAGLYGANDGIQPTTGEREVPSQEPEGQAS